MFLDWKNIGYLSRRAFLREEILSVFWHHTLDYPQFDQEV